MTNFKKILTGVLTTTMTLTMTFALTTGVHAEQQPLYQGGRIAISADGNAHDKDDWGATPASLAIIAKAGKKRKLVNYDYNSHLWGNDFDTVRVDGRDVKKYWDKEMGKSVNGAIDKFGYKFIKDNFFNDQTDKQEAIDNLAAEIEKSTSSNPLYFVLAGPAEILYQAAQKATEGHSNVTVITHSTWNDSNQSNEHPNQCHKLSEVKDVKVHRIDDQNGERTDKDSGFWNVINDKTYEFMKTSENKELNFVYDRIKASGKDDISDSGIVYYLLTGDENGNASKLESFLTGQPQQTINTVSKPLVWIYSDMSDKNIKSSDGKPVNDPDDISAMAGYILMSNEFKTLGIVVSSTHRSQLKNTANQADWAKAYFGSAYESDLKNLNNNIGGYQSSLPFIESCIKETSEHFDPSSSYTTLNNYPSIKALLDKVKNTNEIINVLLWGPLTESAIFVKHLETTGQTDLLSKVRFIAHWTNSSLHQGTVDHPENVANYTDDAKAGKYLKDKAKEKEITYYELGAIGQHGIVSGSQKGTEYYDQFNGSRIGKIFRTGKFEYNCVDHSDSATYWTLLEDYGVSLNDVNSDGTNPTDKEQNNENKFKYNSKRIHDELLRRAKAAAKSN